MGDGLKRARAAARATQASPLAQAAKAIRTDIIAAVRNRDLPPYPDGVTFRVTSRRGALMTAIDIDVENVPHSWAYDNRPGAINRPSQASLLLKEALEKVAARHYQQDGCISFINVQVHLAGEK